MKKLFFLVGIILVSSGIASAGESVMSDRKFFRALNLSLPALKSVKEAVDRKDYAKAGTELIKHFKTRTTPLHGFLLKDWKRPEKPFDPTVADKVCKHIFTASMGSYYLGKRVDWLAKTAKNRDFTASINRFYGGSLGSLDMGYRCTGDEKYAKKFTELITAWIEDAGLPKPGYTSMHPLWGSLTAAMRTGRMICLWHTFLDSPHFTPQVKMNMLKSMLVHGRWLSSKHCRAGGNWVFMISNSLAALGIIFPEFGESDKWVKIAFKRAAEEYKNQVYPDGMQQELTPHYHFVSTAGMKNAVELARWNKRKLPPGFMEIPEKMLEATMYLNMPDGINPPVNDADLLNMRPTPATKPFNLLKASRWYKRADWEYIGSGYTSGVRPKYTSYGFPYAGLYAMRSGWEPKARYLLFDAGPFGAGHTHEDALNIILHAYGKTLLFDTTNSRDGYKHTPFRWYQLKTESHNTIMIDGLGQRRYGNRKTYFTSRPMRNRWVSAPAFDYVEGTYNGIYRDSSRVGSRAKVKAAHTRKIFFLKPDYWVVCDTVSGKGKHKVESLWHLTPGNVKIDNRTRSVRTQNNDANLLILPADPAGLSLRIVKGHKKRKPNIPPKLPDAEFDTYDMQGWGAFGQKTAAVPTPTAIYTKNISLPCSFEMVLYPYPTKQPPAITVTKLKVQKSSAKAVGMMIESEGKKDYLLVSHEKASRKTYGDIEFDGKVACIRQDGKGCIKSMSIVDGARLIKKQRVLIESKGTLDALDIRIDKTVLEISLSNPHQVETLTLYAPGITQVKLNSLEISFTRKDQHIRVRPSRLGAVAKVQELNQAAEKSIIVSHKDGRIHNEFTNRAGICFAAPGHVTFYNISLPPKTKVKLNLSRPFTPGRKKPSREKIPDNPRVFDAPARGSKLTRTFRVNLILTRLAILVEAEALTADKIISSLKAHGGLTP